VLSENVQCSGGSGEALCCGGKGATEKIEFRPGTGVGIRQGLRRLRKKVTDCPFRWEKLQGLKPKSFFCGVFGGTEVPP
jgi:hypothetical protein